MLLLASARPAHADVDAATDAEVDDGSKDPSDAHAEADSEPSDAAPDAEPKDAADTGTKDAAVDGPPPYDAGDGLTPLNELPTSDPESDGNGCSCRSVGGNAKVAAAGAPWMIAAFALLRRRRSRR